MLEAVLGISQVSPGSALPDAPELDWPCCPFPITDPLTAGRHAGAGSLSNRASESALPQSMSSCRHPSAGQARTPLIIAGASTARSTARASSAMTVRLQTHPDGPSTQDFRRLTPVPVSCCRFGSCSVSSFEGDALAAKRFGSWPAISMYIYMKLTQPTPAMPDHTLGDFKA